MAEHLDLDEIRSRLADPRDVAAPLGLLDGARRQAGGGLLIRCPAHADRTASCSLTVGPDATLRVRCFACGLAGDVFHLVAAVERLDVSRDFAAVLARTAELAGLGPEGSRPRPTRARRDPPTPEDPPLADNRFALVVEPIFRMCPILERSPVSADVAAYLAARGLLEQARADGWAALPPVDDQAAFLFVLAEERRCAAEERAAIQAADGCSVDAPITRDEVLRAGLFSRGGFAHPQNRLSIPWRDLDGRIVNVQRRRLDDGEPRYAGCRGRGFSWPYGAGRLRHAGAKTTVALVEGAVDALALEALCAERRDDVVVLGVPGTSGWRAAWTSLVRGRAVALAFDNDAAGERLVEQLTRELAEAGAPRIERWTPPGGAKDWADAWAARKAAA